MMWHFYFVIQLYFSTDTHTSTSFIFLSGLKYEFAVSIKESKLLWINGPYPASIHDITIFRGGKTDQNQEDWDKNSLFFVVPDGVMGIADDGYKGEPKKLVTSKAEQSREMRNFLGRAVDRNLCTLVSNLLIFSGIASDTEEGPKIGWNSTRSVFMQSVCLSNTIWTMVIHYSRCRFGLFLLLTPEIYCIVR